MDHISVTKVSPTLLALQAGGPVVVSNFLIKSIIT